MVWKKRRMYKESEDDLGIYGAEEILLDNDELSPIEEAFMQGYEEAT